MPRKEKITTTNKARSAVVTVNFNWCKATKQDGNRCTRRAKNGTGGYCKQHAK